MLSGHATQFYKKKIEDKRFWKKRWQFLSFSFFLSRSSNREYVQIKCQEIIQSTIFFFQAGENWKNKKKQQPKKMSREMNFNWAGKKNEPTNQIKTKLFLSINHEKKMKWSISSFSLTKNVNFHRHILRWDSRINYGVNDTEMRTKKTRRIKYTRVIYSQMIIRENMN